MVAKSQVPHSKAAVYGTGAGVPVERYSPGLRCVKSRARHSLTGTRQNASLRAELRLRYYVRRAPQVHEALNFDDSVGSGEDFRRGRSFGIWSVQWSGDGREIVAGTNDQVG